SVDGGPGYRVTPVEVVGAWFDPSKMVLPREAVFPEDRTREQTALANTAAMSSSQQGAVAVALDELGIECGDGVMLAGAPAAGAGTASPLSRWSVRCSLPPRWCCRERRSSPRTGPGSRPPWPTPPR